MAFSDIGILIGNVTLNKIERTTKDPMKAQEKLLKRILNKSKNCELGKKYNFAEINGISFKQYVVEKRLQRAILLLKTTNRKMIDIAMDCGFDSISGFYSAFRKKTGTTPNKFFELDV